ncbi:hypothetical protein F5141DRAFT_1063591 [Pisolithus sp. B1]|nr:hypothetical protein F5141DRAFT_1063591 [Pisolithus sp. B1]
MTKGKPGCKNAIHDDTRHSLLISSKYRQAQLDPILNASAQHLPIFQLWLVDGKRAVPDSPASILGYKSSQCTIEQPVPPPIPDLSGPSKTFDETQSMDIDNYWWVGGIPDETWSLRVISPVPLSELWHACINQLPSEDRWNYKMRLPPARHFSLPQSTHPLAMTLYVTWGPDFGIELSVPPDCHFLGYKSKPFLIGPNNLKCYDEVKGMVGDPTDKVISPLGNAFYINDVAKAIAKDGGSGMSQVFNREKMLHEIPSPPAVRVHGSVYFVGELLQESSGGYFIPKRFFLATPSISTAIPASPTEQTSKGCMKELFTLGHSATCTDAGFIVSHEKEIISTSMF